MFGMAAIFKRFNIPQTYLIQKKVVEYIMSGVKHHYMLIKKDFRFPYYAIFNFF